MGRMLWFVLLLITFLIPGCTSQTSADPGVVTIAIDQTPDNLDPRIGQNAASQRIDSLIFNSLVRKNENSDLIPDLALRWEIPEPTTYVFHLRDDVRFHEGGRGDVALQDHSRRDCYRLGVAKRNDRSRAKRFGAGYGRSAAPRRKTQRHARTRNELSIPGVQLYRSRISGCARPAGVCLRH